MTTTAVAPAPRVPRLLGYLLAGAGVAVALGVYGKVHDPTGEQIPHAFFSGTINLKAWLATAVLVLAGAQLVTALAMYGRLPLRGSWVAPVHRSSGQLAFLISLPVAYACLWSIGFQTYDTRTTLHSFLGCAFYGALTAKVLVVRRDRVPGWALPLLGAVVLTAVVALWWTSALWFFTTVGFPAV